MGEKMKIATTYGIYRDNTGRNPHIASLEHLHSAGFESVDINLGGVNLPGHYLAGEDWRQQVELVAQKARELGMDTDQVHLPFFNYADPNLPNLEQRTRNFGKMIEAAGILGAKWAVVHPGNAINSVQGAAESKRRTIEFIKPHLETAEKWGVGLAMENLFVPRSMGRAYRYCARAEEVCDLVDSIDGKVGVCWDFGHANLIKDDQADALRMVGKRLKVLHVHDNNGEQDQHLIPFAYCGTVEWERILPVLKEIEFDGNFNFEVVNPKMPNGAADRFGAFLYQLGVEMVKMIG